MTELKIRNVKDGFGAEITGLDPSKEFDDETRGILRKLFDERSVLLFPRLNADQAYQSKLCRMVIGDDGSGTVSDKSYNISNKEKDGAAPYGRLLFHADMMWHPTPFDVLSLYGTTVEPGSATTSLASGVSAYWALPADLRERVENLQALHVTGQVPGRGGADILDSQRAQEVSTVKPVVQRHPRTGKPILYVGQQNTREIVGLPHDESEALLQTLFSYLYSPANVYEHSWNEGDLLVFDNVAMQHGRGYVELNGPTRTLRKVIAPITTTTAERPRFANAPRM
jgi:taurine dioxygenase